MKAKTIILGTAIVAIMNCGIASAQTGRIVNGTLQGSFAGAARPAATLPSARAISPPPSVQRTIANGKTSGVTGSDLNSTALTIDTRTVSSEMRTAISNKKNIEAGLKRMRQTTLKNSTPPTRPNLANKRQVRNGYPIAGSPSGLKRQGYQVQNAQGTTRGFVATSPAGDKALFLDPKASNYRNVADRNGIKTAGRDVDHAAAKPVNQNGLPTMLTGSNASVNRGWGGVEKNMKAAPVNDGVIYAGPQQIRKLNGQPPVSTARDGLGATFNGVSPSPAQTLSQSGSTVK